MGGQGDSETISGGFVVNLGLLLGSLGEHFGEHVGSSVSKWSICVDCSVLFVGVSKKGAKKVPKIIQKGDILEAVNP